MAKGVVKNGEGSGEKWRNGMVRMAGGASRRMPFVLNFNTNHGGKSDFE
jgi:hypothetical protein